MGASFGSSVPETVSWLTTVTLTLSTVTLPAFTVSFRNVVVPLIDCVVPEKVTVVPLPLAVYAPTFIQLPVSDIVRLG